MVVAYGSEGIVAHITLMEGEKLPVKWNSEKCIVYRWDNVGRVPICIKAYGNVWPLNDERLDKPFEPDITQEHDPWTGLSNDPND
jgi:hypothetical protein